MKKIIVLMLVVIFACFGLCSCEKEPSLNERIEEANRNISRNSQRINDIKNDLQDLSKAINGFKGY